MGIFTVMTLDLLALGPFISAEILPNLRRIAERVRGSRFAAARDAGSLLRLLEAPARPSRRRSEPVGGAHPLQSDERRWTGSCAALRPCCRRARQCPRAAGLRRLPSCSRLIKAHGFDVMPLIGRSGQHTQSHENDLANYVRLRALARDARTLVFDGGYVFDSVYRVILERRLRGVWIRRGLWQASQDNSVALDREKVFDRVIVPGEAFEELNETYSRGDHVRLVGPIVQRLTLDPARRADLRARLAERFGLPFERLVVTLLGAGVAADRGAPVAGALRHDGAADGRPAPRSWSGRPRSARSRSGSAGAEPGGQDPFRRGVGGGGFLRRRGRLQLLPRNALQPGAGGLRAADRLYMDDQRARARAAPRPCRNSPSRAR